MELRIVRTDKITVYTTGRSLTPEQEQKAIDFFKTAPEWVTYMVLRS